MEKLENYSLEKEIQVKEFWEKKKIAEKTLALNKGSKKKFYLMDGPPYATGHIHMGTALNKILKDIAIRSKRMQGYFVFARPGYDTHGLPIENKVEQKLDFKSKQDIENYGVANFVEECRNYATQYINTMNSEFNDLGVWMDWQNPYITLTNEYIEAIWHTFKAAEENGLLFLGKYPVHVCPHCETAVAYNEIEYTKQTDLSIYVKFPLKKEKDVYLLIWTTTPWTLPGNTGVMVNPKVEYVFAKLSNGETWVIAKELLEPLMKAIEAGFTIERTVKGSELEGLEYINPLAKHLKLPEMNNAYRVILSERYVSIEEGTGLVHTAPGHGREDFDAGSKAGLPAISPVKFNGEMTEEAGKYAGKKARIVDNEIIADLEKDNALVYKHNYTHDYPVCWRCKTPLLMLSTPQWFFNIKKIQKKLLDANESVFWQPKWMQARMRNWLESLGDWPVSRKRYWGTPLPIWLCSKCENKVVIGSLAELRKMTRIPENIDLHKPQIDDITIKCRCGSLMKRVEEVLDVWFDSGVSSWAALNYPTEKKLFEDFWPADLNIEGTDQVRGWWNSQLICAMMTFGKKPFKAVMTHGMVLDVSRKKMSKSLGNAVQPKEVIEKYNRDYLRYYFAKTSKGEDISFDWSTFADIQKFFNILWNSFNFVSLYFDLKLSDKINFNELLPEDKWLAGKALLVSRKAIESYNNYAFYNAITAIEDFILEDLSRTYIKLIRDRIGSESQKQVENTLSFTLTVLLKLLSPIVPHMTEFVYQKFKAEEMPESIHLSLFTDLKIPEFAEQLDNEMTLVKQLTQETLSLRNKHDLRLRWPLKELIIESEKQKLVHLTSVVKILCNVKEVKQVQKAVKGNYAIKELPEIKIYLSLEADEQLKKEWELRELTRLIQEERKKLKFNPNEKKALYIDSDDIDFLKEFKVEIEKETNTLLELSYLENKQKLVSRSFALKFK